MSLMMLLAALFMGCFVDALVGLVGSRRRIGFGWAFFLSLIFTPVVGLIATLISEPLPVGQSRWGCLVPTLLSIVFLGVVFFLMTMVFGLIVL
ncbi:MAG: hypothetical protein J6R31_01365 [Rikenellaceae bacterium]|jgi:uncharacterized membrane protein YeaQ/YmgE (transglycosylase-associated protein family)|nr:hypothetical protein [Rikenellaceae bacterium]